MDFSVLEMTYFGVFAPKKILGTHTCKCELTFLGIDDSEGDLIDFFADMTDVGVPGRNPKA